MAETETQWLPRSSTNLWQSRPVTPMRIRSFTTLFTTLVGEPEQCPRAFSHAGSPEVPQLVLQQLCLSRPEVPKREIERVRGISHFAQGGTEVGLNRPLNQPKIKHCHHLLTFLSFLTCMTLFLLQNMTYWIMYQKFWSKLWKSTEFKTFKLQKKNTLCDENIESLLTLKSKP